MTTLARQPDDELLELLAREAMRAEAFERDVLGLSTAMLPVSAAPTAPVVSTSPAWWRVTVTAAAACLALGASFLALTLSAGRGSTVPLLAPPVVAGNDVLLVPVPRPTVDPAPRSASSQPNPWDDLSAFAYLDPGVEGGLPSFDDERSLVLAVYHGADGSTACDCLPWSVEPADRGVGASRAFSQALISPCREGRSMTVYTITGPRTLLPFHEEDARELLACVEPAVSCGLHEGPCEGETPVCLPDGLTLSARTVDVALR
jgi:hypothetical protein